MNKTKEWFRKMKNHKTLRNVFVWKIVHRVELGFNMIYKMCVPFVPALVFSYYEQNFLSALLFFAGFLRLCYNIFDRRSIKEIWLKLQWLIERK